MSLIRKKSIQSKNIFVSKTFQLGRLHRPLDSFISNLNGRFAQYQQHYRDSPQLKTVQQVQNLENVFVLEFNQPIFSCTLSDFVFLDQNNTVIHPAYLTLLKQERQNIFVILANTEIHSVSILSSSQIINFNGICSKPQRIYASVYPFKTFEISNQENAIVNEIYMKTGDTIQVNVEFNEVVNISDIQTSPPMTLISQESLSDHAIWQYTIASTDTFLLFNFYNINGMHSTWISKGKLPYDKDGIFKYIQFEVNGSSNSHITAQLNDIVTLRIASAIPVDLISVQVAGNSVPIDSFTTSDHQNFETTFSVTEDFNQGEVPIAIEVTKQGETTLFTYTTSSSSVPIHNILNIN